MHIFCSNAKPFLKVAFAFVMHCLMLHCFRFVFPALGNYMYDRHKIEDKLSLDRESSSLQYRRILGGRNLVRVRIVVATIFDFMTVEDWGQ